MTERELLETAAKWEAIAARSREDRVKKLKLEEEINKSKINKQNAAMTIFGLKENIRYAMEYLAERKKKGLSNLNMALVAAREIIPHGPKLKINFEKDSVFISDEEGVPINKMDGSGFRALISLFIRDKLLKSNDGIRTLLVDEPLATLDPFSSAEASKFLREMAEDTLVVIVEQKDEVFANIEDYTEYIFEIREGVTHVTKNIKRRNRDEVSL